jgi:molecular chaperone DnaK (HSP70)
MGIVTSKEKAKETSEVNKKIEKNIIGIDLGTENCCLAILQNKNIEVIPNRYSNKLTPSYVALTEDNKWLVGEEAKEQAMNNPFNTVYDIKRLIGHSFDDLNNLKKQWPFKVINCNGNPAVEFSHKGGTIVKSPEEILAELIKHMKQIAVNKIGNDVKAVITVPAYFNQLQRKMTELACNIAQLEVIKIFNEPAAASLDFVFDSYISSFGLKNTCGNCLIFDLGGGTFDMSILRMENGQARIVSSYGDTNLGGNDFNNRMVEYFVNEIKETYDVDLTDDKASRYSLFIESEKAKRILSEKEEASFKFELKNYGIIMLSITRTKFEELNSNLFEKMFSLLERMLMYEFCPLWFPYPPPILKDNKYMTLVNISEWFKLRLEYEELTEKYKNSMSGPIVVEEGENYHVLFTNDENLKRNLNKKPEMDYNSLIRDLRNLNIEERVKALESQLSPVESEKLNSMVQKDYINVVCLIGGSTKIPKITHLLENFFSQKGIAHPFNPEFAVVRGAAIEAVKIETPYKLILHGINVLVCRKLYLEMEDCISMSYGIENADGQMDFLLRRNEKIPNDKKILYKNNLSIDTINNSVLIKFFQGEKAYASENLFLCELQLSDIMPLNLEIGITVDKNALVRFELHNIRTGKKVSTEINKNDLKGCILMSDVDQRVKQDKLQHFLDSKRKSEKTNTNKDLLYYRFLLETFENNLLEPIQMSKKSFELLKDYEDQEKALEIDFKFPFNENIDEYECKVKSVKLERIFPSNAKPKLLNCFPSEKRLLFKIGDNLYDDQIVMAYLSVFNEIWRHAGIKFTWKRGEFETETEEFISNKLYKIVPLADSSFKSGFIEILEAKSAEEIYDRNSFLRNYSWIANLNKFEIFPGPEHKYNDVANSLGSGGRDFTRLCATAIGTFVSMFVLGIGDRHQGNMRKKSI